MPRLIAIVACVLLLWPAFAQAQEASPTPTRTPPVRLGPPPVASASRFWTASVDANFDFLFTAVLLYESSDEAAEAFVTLPQNSMAIDEYLDESPKLTVVSAPPLGDASALYQIEFSIGGGSNDVDYDLYVQVDRWVYVFSATKRDVDSYDLPLTSVVNDLVTTAQNVVSRELSDATPTTVMGMTTGGIFDLLPGPGDVPAGLTLYSESGEIDGTPVVVPTATPTATPTAEPPPADIELQDIRFQPTTFTIKADRPVEVVLRNVGVAPHNFSIDALNINQDVLPGQTETVTVKAAPGTYEFYCNVPGHKEAGMVGTLIVQ
jgi:plastocyanin